MGNVLSLKSEVQPIVGYSILCLWEALLPVQHRLEDVHFGGTLGSKGKYGRVLEGKYAHIWPDQVSAMP